MKVFGVILFLISLAFILSGLYAIKKSDHTLNVLEWVIVGIISLMCVYAFAGGLMSLVGIHIGLASFSALNLLLGGLLWFKICKNRAVQRYTISWYDIVCFALLVGVSVALGVWQYTAHLEIHFETSDPSRHLFYALQVYNSGKVSDMYFSSLINALALSLSAPFISEFSFYKIFTLMNVAMQVLSALMFFVLIRRLLDTAFLKVVGILGALVYMLAYPLNNMLFGFVYLGQGVMLISLIAYLANVYSEKVLHPAVTIVLLSLACLSLFLCYMLFVPVVFLALFLFIALTIGIRRANLKTILAHELAVFALPCLMGLYYCYFQYFLSGSSTPVSAIAGEGYIYRNLYSNVLPFLPFAVYAVIQAFQKRAWDFTTICLPLLLVFMIVLFAGGMQGKVSSYYFYKNYYPLWLLLVYLTVYAMQALQKNIKLLLTLCMGAYFVLAGLHYTGWDDEVTQKNVYFNPVPKSGYFFDLYDFNLSCMKERNILTNEKIYLWKQAYRLKGPGEKVPLIGDWFNIFWYEAITNQKLEPYWWNIGGEAYMQTLLTDKDCRYAVIMEGDLYSAYKAYLDGLPVVYRNETGFIVQLKP